MKKNKLSIITITLLSSLLLFSCASSKNIEDVQLDSYAGENEEEPVKIESKKTSTTNTKSNSKTKKKKTFSEGVKDFFTFGNKNDFVKTDSSSVFTTTATGSIKLQDSQIFISTKEDLAGFGSAYMAAYYIVLMDTDSRAKLAKAFDSYLSDFDNKRLNRKDTKSFKKYGTFKTTLNWGPLEATTPNHGSGTAYLGYEFKKNSPYFVLSNYAYYNDYYDVAGDSTTRESMNLKYYFTKAQMKELLSMIDEEVIANALFEDSSSSMEDAYSDTDEYLSPESEDTETIEE